VKALKAVPLALLLVAGAAGAEVEADVQQGGETVQETDTGVAEHAEAQLDYAPGEGHHTEEGEHGPGHGHDVSQINWVRWYWSEGYTKDEPPPFIAMVFNFAVLLLLLYFASRKTVKRYLRERRDRLMESIDEASRLKKEAEESHKLYTEKLARMKEEEEQIRDELLKAAKREKDRLVADAGARAEKMRSEAKRLVEQEQAEAAQRLKHETVTRAIEVARESLEKKIGPGEQRKLVNEYLAQLGEQVKS
jgi:F-type H+-transporting ATPase subunit b